MLSELKNQAGPDLSYNSQCNLFLSMASPERCLTLQEIVDNHRRYIKAVSDISNRHNKYILNVKGENVHMVFMSIKVFMLYGLEHFFHEQGL